MAINFPNNPSVNDTFTVGGIQFTFTGVKWESGAVVEISSDGITSGSTMVLSTNNGDKMINTLMGEKISEIKANGELRTKKDVSENLFVNDNVILDNCEDTLSSNDGSYLVKSLTRNVVTKYTCAVECHNSSIVVTTTTSAPAISS